MKSKYIHEGKDNELTKSQLLDNAIDYIFSLVEHDDWICNELLDIPKEAEICSATCENISKKCILRFLKHYKNHETRRAGT